MFHQIFFFLATPKYNIIVIDGQESCIVFGEVISSYDSSSVIQIKVWGGGGTCNLLVALCLGGLVN